MEGQRGVAAQFFSRLAQSDVLDGDKLLATLPDRRFQATHAGIGNDIATIGPPLVHIIGSGPQRAVDDPRGF